MDSIELSSVATDTDVPTEHTSVSSVADSAYGLLGENDDRHPGRFRTYANFYDFKSFKTYCLTYLRQNYLRIFIILVTLLFLLIIIIIVLSIWIGKEAVIVQQNGTDSAFVKEVTGIPNFVSVPPSNNLSTKTPSIDDVRTMPADLAKIVCARIHCGINCTVKSLDYNDVKYLSCCGCFPHDIKFYRYSKSQITGSVFMVFRPQFDISYMNAKQLSVYPQIPGLKGTWDITQESDKTHYLVYGGVTIDNDATDEIVN
jgi:hypothetical protein